MQVKFPSQRRSAVVSATANESFQELGTSFGAAICELYVISDHVQRLYLAKAALPAGQEAVASKPVDTLLVHFAGKQHSRVPRARLLALLHVREISA